MEVTLTTMSVLIVEKLIVPQVIWPDIDRLIGKYKVFWSKLLSDALCSKNIQNVKLRLDCSNVIILLPDFT